MVFYLSRYPARAGWAAGLLAGLLLAGCGPAPSDSCVLLQSDFEQFEGWAHPLPPFLSTEQAHSGRYSYRLVEGTDFGSKFQQPLGISCAFVPRKLRLSGWVYLPSGRIGSTKLVVEINCQGRRKNVWECLEVQEVVKRYGKWEYVQKIIRLPPDLEPSDILQLYVWHVEAGDPTWFDDLRLEGWR
ncbi:hypothetical protein [Hymenobacter metallilatus]|uniref:CBM-cenC domain-containing protein n=1 Tax=Hymenobacter metallilatus TaxID=2493666 RepID=A0A3R9NCX4_9BACT|nr:hypothetical protein [Hymenobacter metallilatus]RSK31154.1 hypothetical protein EI290_14125 [Hymenobacter metallilatus]